MEQQVAYLFLLALPIACISWTVTHEDIFREPREYCIDQSKRTGSALRRKFFYLFTCEYCFSHYVTILFLFISKYQLLLAGWRGYLIAGFALVWIANLYMTLFGLLRQGLKREKIEASIKEETLKEVKQAD